MKQRLLWTIVSVRLINAFHERILLVHPTPIYKFARISKISCLKSIPF